jgi:2-polyprenyl-3-methyl-5-hydroxy-6-metoxy-1,4-benzoquinol methylase
MAADENKLNDLVGRMIGDVGAAFGAALVIVGDKLGLYKALADSGPLTASELAQRTSTAPRYIREWTAAQAATGYISYDAASDRFSMSPEQAMVFADSSSPVFFPGAFEVAAAMMRIEPKISEAFKTGGGVGWHEHDPILFRGAERFFRPGYAANLVSSWIPALDGVQARLDRGIDVADVGCGHGASTILMAQAYPKSQFKGFDYHQASIERASVAAREAGVSNVRFERAASKDYPGRYDLVAFFDCLHDMGDPVGAAAHSLKALKRDGTMMVVEPFGNDRMADNIASPIGRLFYSASTMVCVPASLSQEVGLALGTQAGEARLFEVIKQGGFTRVRTATTTPFNRIIEARP